MHLQERGNLQQSQLAAFLTGQLSAEEAVKSSRKAELLCQVQNFLISTQQVRKRFAFLSSPTLTVCYVCVLAKYFYNTINNFLKYVHKLLACHDVPAMPAFVCCVCTFPGRSLPCAASTFVPLGRPMTTTKCASPSTSTCFCCARRAPPTTAAAPTAPGVAPSRTRSSFPPAMPCASPTASSRSNYRWVPNIYINQHIFLKKYICIFIILLFYYIYIMYYYYINISLLIVCITVQGSILTSFFLCVAG